MTDFTERITDIPLWSIALFVGVLALIRVFVLKANIAKADIVAEVIEIFIVPIVLVYFIIQPLIMKVFWIPSGSMRPTLIDDDHIVVDKLSYRLHRPRRDDVVVFVAPPAALAQSPPGEFDQDDGPVYYIKRLIGLPGDVVYTREGYIVVNGRRYNHSDIRAALGISPDDETARDVDHVKIQANDIAVYDGTKWTTYDADQVSQTFGLPGAKVEFHPGETVRDGVVLNEPFTAEDPDYNFKLVDGKAILSGDDTGGDVDIDGTPADPSDPAEQALINSPPGPVPPGDLLMMGDNRNDSEDSTHWGPLAMTRVTGKARWIFVPISRMRTIH